MNQTDTTTETICGLQTCDRPSNGFFICRFHAHDLTKTLEQLSWILGELDLVTSLQTRYTNGGQRGGSEPVPMDFVAADIQRELIGAVLNAGIRLSRAYGWPLPETAPEAATVLHWRITAVQLYPDAAVLVDRIFRAVKSALYVIDRPVVRRYLGTCESLQPKTNPCPGSVYGREWRTWASCDTCGLRWDQAKLQTYLIAQLADRLATAAEIADLSRYLGLTITRDQTRKRLNQWHKRGTLTATGYRNGTPTFRFGDAEILLARYSE